MQKIGESPDGLEGPHEQTAISNNRKANRKEGFDARTRRARKSPRTRCTWPLGNRASSEQGAEEARNVVFRCRNPKHGTRTRSRAGSNTGGARVREGGVAVGLSFTGEIARGGTSEWKIVRPQAM